MSGAATPGAALLTLVAETHFEALPNERVADLRMGRDPERLRRELGVKFRTLTEPRLGASETARLCDALGRVDEIEDFTELTRRARS